MSDRWFRFYEDTINHPKTARLPASLFRTWVFLLCVASKEGGKLPDIEAIAFHLRREVGSVSRDITALLAAELLDEIDGGYVPHNWNIRQYKSDTKDPTAPDRMVRYRNNKRNADRNAPVTVTAPRDRVQITDTDKKDIRAVAKATRPSDSHFEKFWEVYPKRDGANPKEPARKKFETAVKNGHDPGEIIAAAARYAAEMRGKGQERTPYVAQSKTWLEQARWRDYPPVAPVTHSPVIPNEFAVKLFRETGRWNVAYGPEPDKPGCRAPPEFLAKFGFKAGEAA